ncbi:MAG TPA: crosslink repair DNA glycosylase YcaQ family protein, partial [Capillimicrobium sp.]
MSAPALSVTQAQVLAWRAARQRLVERRAGSDPAAVARDLVGLHAQVLSSAELTAWARLEAPRPGAVADALWEDRSLVKTWAMRGTLHALAPEDAALACGALQAIRPRWLAPSWQREFGVSAAEMERLLGALPEALAGEPLTREQLADALGELTGAPHLADRLR